MVVPLRLDFGPEALDCLHHVPQLDGRQRLTAARHVVDNLGPDQLEQPPAERGAQPYVPRGAPGDHRIPQGVQHLAHLDRGFRVAGLVRPADVHSPYGLVEQRPQRTRAPGSGKRQHGRSAPALGVAAVHARPQIDRNDQLCVAAVGGAPIPPGAPLVPPRPRPTLARDAGHAVSCSAPVSGSRDRYIPCFSSMRYSVDRSTPAISAARDMLPAVWSSRVARYCFWKSASARSRAA
jgi:hypothetical protein